MHNPCRAFLTALIILTCNITHAGENYYTNIGLVDVPKDHADKFPICEKELKVNWLNKEKKYGYTEYDTYFNDKYIDKFKAFVSLGSPVLSYKLVAYYPRNQNDGKKSLISQRASKNSYYPYFVDKQRLVNDNFEELLKLVSTYGLEDSQNNFYPTSQSKTIQQIVTQIERLSLTNHTKNVCIIFPNEEYAWLVELKFIKYTHTIEAIDAFYKNAKNNFMPELLKSNPEAHRNLFNLFSSYDLNQDGHADYFNNYSAFYSVIDDNGGVDYRYKESFVGCETVKTATDGSQIITNGHNFYSKGCHLNEFLSQ